MRVILRSRETCFSACAAKAGFHSQFGNFPFPFWNRNLVKGSKPSISSQTIHSQEKIKSNSCHTFLLHLLFWKYRQLIRRGIHIPRLFC